MNSPVISIADIASMVIEETTQKYAEHYEVNEERMKSLNALLKQMEYYRRANPQHISAFSIETDEATGSPDWINITLISDSLYLMNKDLCGMASASLLYPSVYVEPAKSGNDEPELTVRITVCGIWDEKEGE